MWKEFKEFALKGSIVDLAIAVVMGGAFGQVVNGLVNNIIMPLVGYFTAGVDFVSLKFVLRPAVTKLGIVVKPEVAILYGAFINTIINFIIIALCIFFIVKAINRANARKNEEKKRLDEEAAIAAAAIIPEDIQLLRDIRDLLRTKSMDTDLSGSEEEFQKAEEVRTQIDGAINITDHQ